MQEAAASGVKVGEARRLLKVMQGLEAAVQAAVEGPFQYQALKVGVSIQKRAPEGECILRVTEYVSLGGGGCPIRVFLCFACSMCKGCMNAIRCHEV